MPHSVLYSLSEKKKKKEFSVVKGPSGHEKQDLVAVVGKDHLTSTYIWVVPIPEIGQIQVTLQR